MSFWSRARALFSRRRIDREIDDEMRFHLEMRTRDNLAAGMSLKDAERDARLRFGNLTAHRESARDVRGAGFLELALWDLRLAARGLLRRPAFSLGVVVTLALGIAAATVVFSAADAVLLRPLPYAEPDRLVWLWEPMKTGEDPRVSSVGDAEDWRAQSATSFSTMAEWFTWTYTLTGVDTPERLTAVVAQGDLLGVLGVAPRIGRGFVAADQDPDAPNVVVLSDRAWHRRFAADPDIVGREILLNGARTTVVGVMPAGFAFPDPGIDLWRPAGFSAERLTDRRGRFVHVLGRLAPGVTLSGARAGLDTIAARLSADHPDTSDSAILAAPLAEIVVGKVRPALALLGGAVGLVLLLAAVNAGGLGLARAAARRRELAVRIALGASRRRLLGQSLAESALLAVAAAALGVLLASWGLAAFVAWNPGDIPRLDEARLDGRVLAFALAVSVAATLLAGLVPAVVASRAHPDEALRNLPSGGPARVRLREVFAVAQIALAVVLLVGAGLLSHSFLELRAVDPGFRTDRLLSFRVSLPEGKYPDNPRQIAFFRALDERLAALPGVSGVGAVQDLPIRGNSMSYDLTVAGEPRPPGAPAFTAAYRMVTTGYLEAMGIPLIAGRRLVAADDEHTAPVVVVNQTLARRLFPDENPIGKQLRFEGADTPWCTIVGVVGDVKHTGLGTDEGPAFYQPLAQKPVYVRWMTVVLRSSLDPQTLTKSARTEVAALDAALAVYDVTTMDDLLAHSVAAPRFYAAILLMLAGLALTLAAVGVYALVAYLVAQRHQEIAIRIALGARRGHVVRMVLGRGVALAVAGGALGMAGAVATSRALAAFLFGVSRFDPVTYTLVPLFLLVVAVVACVVPARRALRVDPLITLRDA